MFSCIKGHGGKCIELKIKILKKEIVLLQFTEIEMTGLLVCGIWNGSVIIPIKLLDKLREKLLNQMEKLEL